MSMCYCELWYCKYDEMKRNKLKWEKKNQILTWKSAHNERRSIEMRQVERNVKEIPVNYIGFYSTCLLNANHFSKTSKNLASVPCEIIKMYQVSKQFMIATLSPKACINRTLGFVTVLDSSLIQIKDAFFLSSNFAFFTFLIDATKIFMLLQTLQN